MSRCLAPADKVMDRMEAWNQARKNPKVSDRRFVCRRRLFFGERDEREDVTTMARPVSTLVS